MTTMIITVELSNIQHLHRATLTLDLSNNKLTCIVGKNGVGKTTLIKAIRNLYLSETFKQTSADYIFTPDSSITYSLNGSSYHFAFDASISSLNCNTPIPESTKELLDVELPLPHGQRFLFFPTISNIDLDLRKAIITGEYSTPHELINFLKEIYESDKFDNLKSIAIKGVNYYCILLPNDRYIREDYLSSGEYLLINIYRKIKKQRKLIVIDEIDISLDAAAQARLVGRLRIWCQEFQVNILFTTHSLAMMKMLDNNELYYMSLENQAVKIKPESYNYIKSLMFGFLGWDKYILTEDIRLHNFLLYIINRYCPNTFFKYHIIFTGTSTSVADLLQKNIAAQFLSTADNVIAVLDGDQRNLDIGQRANTFCIPIDSVEKELHRMHENGGIHPRYSIRIPVREHKRVFNDLIARKLMTETEIYNLICNAHNDKIQEFANHLEQFLAYHA